VATKLYLRNAQTHGLTPSGDTTWYDMATTAGASVDTGVVNTAGSGTEIQWTKTAGGSTIAWISGRVPSGGFTLTSTDVDLWAQESNGQANCGGRYRVFKRASNGTITEVGGGPFNDGVEFGTSAASMTWTGNVTDTAFAEDDRILVRFYITNVGTMGSGRTCTMSFNAADAATGDSFFNIAETVSFKANADPQQADPGLGGVTIAGLAPTVTASNHQLVTAGLGAGTIAGLAPTVTASNHQSVTAGLGVAVIAGLAPAVAVSDNQVASPALGAATVAGLAPTVSATANVQVTAGLGAAILAGLAPTASATAHVSVTPALGAATLAGLAPTVTATAHVTVTPGLGDAVADGLAPTATATAHVTVTPDVGAVVAAGFAPGAQGGEGLTINTGLGSASIAGLAPTVATPVVVTVPVGSGVWVGLAPLVLTPVEVATALGELAAEGSVPDVAVGGVEAWAEPGVGYVVLCGLRPTVTGDPPAPERPARLMGGGKSMSDAVDMILGDRPKRRRWL